MSHLVQKPFLLAAEGLNKSFDGYRAINDLNFYLDEGELRTVIGPNGAGKTTFLDLITGRTQPDEGTLTWDDGKHDLLKCRRLSKSGINCLSKSGEVFLIIKTA